MVATRGWEVLPIKIFCLPCTFGIDKLHAMSSTVTSTANSLLNQSPYNCILVSNVQVYF